MRILFDSKLSRYKEPFGALREGERCRISLWIPASCRTRWAQLCLKKESGALIITADALRNPQDEEDVRKMRESYDRRRRLMVEGLRSMGLDCFEPRGAFYVMAALPVENADDFQMWLLNEFDDNSETILFACGEPFYGTPGRGKNEIRIAYTINAPDIKRSMEILKIALEKYNNR